MCVCISGCDRSLFNRLVQRHIKHCTFVLIICGAALSGCSMVGPDYQPPPVSTAAHWLQIGNANINADSPELNDWWKVFNDPVLESLISTAYAQNLPLRVAGIRVLEARARLAIAMGEYYPQQQQAFGSYSYSRISENSAEASPGRSLDFRSAEFGMGASWEMDFWGKFRRAIQAEDTNLLASMAAYDDALVTLLSDVATTYVVIRTFEEQLEIARKNVSIQRETWKIADARFRGGQTGERDVQQALTQLRATEATIPQLELSLQQAKNALSILLGLTPAELVSKLGSGIGSSGVIPVAPIKIAAGIPADLLRRRPDIRLAELRAMTQSSLVGVAEAELYPSFSLGGSFGLVSADNGSADVSDVFSITSRTAAIGPSFVWNILNYGQLTNAVRVQDARLQQALVDYQNSVLLAQREVEDSLVGFAKSREVVGLLTQAATAARSTVQLSRIQYEGGTTDYTTVINAQAALLEQENALAQARSAVPQSLIGLYRALGGGWQIREGHDFVPDAVKEEMQQRTDWGSLLVPAALEGGSVEQEPLRKPAW